MTDTILNWRAILLVLLTALSKGGLVQSTAVSSSVDPTRFLRTTSDGRIVAFIPAAYREAHASSIISLPGDELLLAFFCGLEGRDTTYILVRRQ